MTRVNVGIHPKELPGKLLLAEHREITRIPNAVRSGRAVTRNIPTTFTLGTGHVRFFYNKLHYLSKRYNMIYQECKRRGYNVTNKHSAFQGISPQYLGDYTEQPQDRQIIINRIHSKGYKLQ